MDREWFRHNYFRYITNKDIDVFKTLGRDIADKFNE